MSSLVSEVPWAALWMACLFLPSAVWLLGLVRWIGRQKRNPGGLLQGSPAAVIVVGRNEEAGIAACLRSVMANPAETVSRVVFVDDGSADDTLEIAKTVSREDSRLIVHEQHGLSPGFHSPKKQALAYAFNVVDTEAVAVTDADCVVSARWIESMQRERRARVGAVLGASWPSEQRGFVAKSYRWERLTANVVMASSCGWGSPASACGHSILYRADALSEVAAPVFRTLPSGDDDLTVQAIWRRGWQIEFCGDPHSVVREAGVRGSRLAQAARHQSVTHLYPKRWRLMFAWTTLSGLAVYPLTLWWTVAGAAPYAVTVLLLKMTLDFASGLILARRLKLDISAGDILCGAAVLPLWMLWRVVAVAVSKKFKWKDREFALSGARPLGTSNP